MRFKQFRTSQYSDESRGNQCDTSKYMGEILIVLIDSNYQGQLNLLPTHLLELPFQCCEKAIQTMLCFNPNLILTLLVESMDMTQQAGAVTKREWPTNYHGSTIWERQTVCTDHRASATWGERTHLNDPRIRRCNAKFHRTHPITTWA